MLRNLIYIGGDVDTNAAIAFSILEAFIPIPENMLKLMPELPAEWRLYADIPEFNCAPISTFQKWFPSLSKAHMKI